MRESRLRRIRLHDLRHTHATLALQAGLHPKVVSDRLGHSSTTVTLDVYSHVTPSLQEEAATTVAALFMTAITAAAEPADQTKKATQVSRRSTSKSSRAPTDTRRRDSRTQNANVCKPLVATRDSDKPPDATTPLLTSDSLEPERGIEPLTYALRVRRSAG